MKLTVKIIAFALLLILVNCKNETVTIEYKYADKPKAITCGNNSTLYLEALYSFEDDILNFYSKNNTSSTRKPSLSAAYRFFLGRAIYNRVPYESVVSEHSLKVFEALKNDNTLWDAENTKSHLNYSSPLIKCISENMKDDNLSKTFNALLSINDLSPKLFGPPLLTKYNNALKDKYLASYIAFDLYYSKLFDIDYSKINFDKTEAASKVDFNKKPVTK